jgi:hypothetical protein
MPTNPVKINYQLAHPDQVASATIELKNNTHTHLTTFTVSPIDDQPHRHTFTGYNNNTYYATATITPTGDRTPIVTELGPYTF